jgi:hypothetical protein
MCFKCLHNGTKCEYSPSLRQGKRKGDPHPAGHKHQAQPNISDNPSHIDNAINPFWLGQNGFGSSLYGLNHHEGVDIVPNPCQNNLPPMPPASMSSSPATVYTPLHDHLMISFDQVNPSGDNLLLPLAHSRSNSYDTATTMSRTNSFQATRDIQQTFDLNLTPLSTPPGMGMNYSSFLPTESQVTAPAIGSHRAAAVPGNRPHNAQQSSTAFAGFEVGGRCECFKTCLKCLIALRETGPSSVDRILRVNGTAMHACLRLLECLLCKNSIEADTVSVVASIIDKVSSLYKYVFQILDKDLVPVEAHRGGFSCTHSRDKMQQLLSQRVATLQDVRGRFIEMCWNLSEALAIASAWVDHVNNQMAWIDAWHFSPAQTIQDGNFAGENNAHFGSEFN